MIRVRSWLRIRLTFVFWASRSSACKGTCACLRPTAPKCGPTCLRLEGNVAGVKADVTRVEMRMDAFAERVDDRFEQTVELIKSHFRTVDQKVDRTRDELSEKIDGVRDDLSEKIDRVRNEMNEKIDRIESKIDQLRR